MTIPEPKFRNGEIVMRRDMSSPYDTKSKDRVCGVYYDHTGGEWCYEFEDFDYFWAEGDLEKIS